jgi:Kef-type K+ transport system membrane component KefB
MELIDFNLFKWLKTAHPLVFLGLLLLLSYAGGKVASYFKAPRVTGYLVVGILLSPSALGLFHERLVKEDLTLVTDIALSIIAFSIGGTLRLAKLKKLGKHILWITLAEASGAFLVVTAILSLAFFLLHGFKPLAPSFLTLYLPLALMIGALSAATAPAATLAIIHEYEAKGPLTATLLGVVALDDALTIVFFTFASAAANSLVNHQAITWLSVMVAPFLSILVSLAIGGAFGIALRKLIRFVPRKKAMFGVMVGAIFLAGGLAINLKVSPLLANMMLGFVVTNFVARHEDLFAVVENIDEPIFGMFFALAGAHFDFRVMEEAGGLALLIILGRFVGKLLGSRLGARLSQAPEVVRKYLGFALLPKAGVTVGLVLAAKEVFGPTTYQAEVMVNAVLGSVIINELMTPFFVRFALFKAGEATRT